MAVKANDLAVRALKPRNSEYEVAVKEHRGLVVRVHPSGARTFLLRYRQDGSLKRVSLEAQNLASARVEWQVQYAHVRGGEDPAEKRKTAKAEKRQARLLDRANRMERESGAATVGRLCVVYCDYLKARGRISAAKVRADLDRYVITGLDGSKKGGEKPAIRAAREAAASTLARDFSRSDAAQLIRGIAETGKRRTAGIIRSYLKAAYALALSAESDAQAPSELIAFRIQSNPLADLKAIPVGKRDRTLNVDELRAFLKRLDAEPGHVADALWFCLLTGGQRPQQVLRATVADYRAETGELHLRDAKGKREEPRLHVVPLASRGRKLAEKLSQRALKLREELQQKGEATGPAPLFSTSGKVRLDIGTLSARVTGASRAMVEAGEASSPFQMKDLRRTVETLLAAKVSKDIRAQLLSHGLSGVQASNYDWHGYLQEKRQALAIWERKLSEIQGALPAKVVPIRAA